MAILPFVLCAFMGAGANHEARIEQSGLIGGTPLGQKKSTTVDSGTRLVMEGLSVRRQTSTLLGRKGASFGFTYTFNNANPQKHFLVEEIIIFPKELKDPKSGKAYKVETEKMYLKNNMRRTFAYTIEESWENIPGIWQFIVKCDGKMLVKKEFIVR